MWVKGILAEGCVGRSLARWMGLSTVLGAAMGAGCGGDGGRVGETTGLDGAGEVALDTVAPEAAPEAAPEVDETEVATELPAIEVSTSWEDNFGVVERDGDPVCDGTDATHCLFPFPSDHFRVVAGGGAHLRLAGAMPRDADGAMLGAEGWERRDGWSAMTPIYFAFPGVDIPRPTPIAGQPFDIARSLGSDSEAILVRADTGARIPHWLELDHFSITGGHPIVALRPAVPLPFGTRIVVGVRGLRDASQALVRAHPGFQALRDQSVSHVLGIHARRAHFDADIFPLLAANGFARGELQLAWDFTTASEADTNGLALAMRDALYAAIGADGPTYAVTEVAELDDPDIARMITLRVDVPSFLLPEVGGFRRVRRDALGKPLAEGFEAVVCEIQIPRAALAHPGQASVLQYGHGLFWSREEAHKDWLRKIANRENIVLVASDLQGMSGSDISTWSDVLSHDLGQLPWLAESPLQGVMNHLAVQRLVRGRLAISNEAALTALQEDQTRALLYDPSRLGYYGVSQGGTFGTVIMALTDDVRRGVLGVPGAAWSFLMQRSVAFTSFAGLLQLYFPDPVEFTALMGLIQTAYDPIDPISFRGLLAGSTSRTVLLQVARGDATVENEVSFLLGRAVGASLLEPAVRPVFGLPDVTAPASGNTVTEFDFGKPVDFDPFFPLPREHDTHEDLRRLRVAQDQIVQFLATGVVSHLCTDTCDPE